MRYYWYYHILSSNHSNHSFSSLSGRIRRQDLVAVPGETWCLPGHCRGGGEVFPEILGRAGELQWMQVSLLEPHVHLYQEQLGCSVQNAVHAVCHWINAILDISWQRSAGKTEVIECNWQFHLVSPRFSFPIFSLWAVLHQVWDLCLAAIGSYDPPGVRLGMAGTTLGHNGCQKRQGPPKKSK